MISITAIGGAGEATAGACGDATGAVGRLTLLCSDTVVFAVGTEVFDSATISVGDWLMVIRRRVGSDDEEHCSERFHVKVLFFAY